MAAPFTVQSAYVDGEGGGNTLVISSGALKAGRLYLLCVGADRGSNAAQGPPDSVAMAGGGATWTLATQGANTASIAHGASAREHGTVYRCQPAADVASANITITWSNSPIRRTAAIIVGDESILNDSANNGAGCFRKIAIDGITGGTESTYDVALPSLGLVTSDGFVGVFWSRTGAANTHTPGSGFIELSDDSTSLGTTINLTQTIEAWNNSVGTPDNIVDLTRDSGSNTWGGIALEINRSGYVLDTSGPAVVNVVGVAGDPAGSNVAAASAVGVVNVLGVAGDPAGSNVTSTGTPAVVNVEAVAGDPAGSAATLASGIAVVNVEAIAGTLVPNAGTATATPAIVDVSGEPGTATGSPAELEPGIAVVNVEGVGGELIQSLPPGQLLGTAAVVNVSGEPGDPEGSAVTVAGGASVVNVEAPSGELDITNVVVGSPSAVDVIGVGGALFATPGEVVSGAASVDVLGIGGTAGAGAISLTGSPAIVNITTPGGLLFVGEMALDLPVNIEALVSAFLRDQPEIIALVMDRVYTALPKPAAGRDVPPESVYPCIRVSQIIDDPNSGPLWGIGFEVQIEAFGGSKAEAWRIAATARACIDRRIPGVHMYFGVVSGVSHGGMIDLPDEAHRPAKPRWLFTSTITAHPAASLSAS